MTRWNAKSYGYTEAAATSWVGGAGEGCAGNVTFELGLKGWLWILGPGEEKSLWREAWKGTAYPRDSKRWREEGAGQRMKMENKRGAKLDFVLACSRSQVMWDLNSSLRSLHEPEEQIVLSLTLCTVYMGGAPMTERKRPKQRCLFQTRLPVKSPVDRISQLHRVPALFITLPFQEP